MKKKKGVVESIVSVCQTGKCMCNISTVNESLLMSHVSMYTPPPSHPQDVLVKVN